MNVKRGWPATVGLCALWLATNAAAQSDALRDAVQLHRDSAHELAKSELADCTRTGCDRLRELSLLAGQLALSEGAAEEALSQLTRIKPPDDLEPFHAFYLAEAQFYRRLYNDAATNFARVAAKGPAWLAVRASARAGEALLAAGDCAQASSLLEKAALELGTPELFHQRARCRKRLGNLDGERADLTLLAVRFATHPYGERALALLEQDKRRAFRLTFEDRLRRARDFIDHGQPQRGLAELDIVKKQQLDKGASAKAKLALVAALAHFALRDEVSGQAQLDQATKGQPNVAAAALLIRARRSLKSDDNEEARKRMAEVEARFPRESEAEEGGYFVAWLDFKMGKYEQAVADFDAFDKRYNRSHRRDDAQWFKSLALYKLERWADARAQLTTLADTFPRSAYVPQARYWAARCLQNLGNALEQVKAELTLVISTFPASWYAVLAAERLRGLGAPVQKAFSDRPKLSRGPTPPELKLGNALAQAGLWRDAADELQLQIGRVRDADALRIGQGLLAIGEYGAAHALAARLLWAEGFTAKMPEALALFYPRPHAQTVEAEAKRWSVDPYLVWAIMRRESAFRPAVQSLADARGLMQIIPPTAAAIRKELNLAVVSPDELYGPELSIQLAAWYLSKLVERFEHPALAAAAYNAGPGAVAKWATEKSALPLDLFVEEIPFRETRAYVKQVVADIFVYHQLYSEEAQIPRLSLEIPTPSATGIGF